MRTLFLLGILLISSFSVFSQEQKTNLPTFYITTDGGAPVLDKENWVKGNITVVSSDPTESLSMVTEVRGRGNSTWGMAKKPYRLKLNSKTNLLNLAAKEKNWVLLANYADKTLMRNAVAFKLSEFVGLEFSPSVRFVDVVLNNTFLGNYMVSDQMEVAEHRVPVQQQEITDDKLPELSGGYLLEIDGFAERELVWFRTDKGLKITIKYPKDDEINARQRGYIETFTHDFENKLFADNFKDKDAGYRALVDSTSLVNWYICCELTGNSDSFWSTYIYKYRHIDKFFFGPLWDFDIAFNNDNRLGDATQKLMRNHAHNPRTWIQRLWEDEWFRNAVDRRWKELVQADVLDTLLKYIDDTAVLLNQSQTANFQSWNILNKWVYNEQFLFPTYQGGVDYLKTYLRNRVEFLSENLASEPEKPTPPFVAEDFYYKMMNKTTNNLISVENKSTTNNAKLLMWAALEGEPEQEWIIKSIDDNKFQFINRNSNMAMAGNGRGANLIQATPNIADASQQWIITPVKTNGLYGLINVGSGFAADNNNGSFSNGTAVIEYPSDIISNENQQWYLQKIESINDPSSLPIMPTNNSDIMIFPNPASENVYITLTDVTASELTLSLYRIDGACIYKSYHPDNHESIIIPLKENKIPSGLYILKVKTKNGDSYSSKLIVR